MITRRIRLRFGLLVFAVAALGSASAAQGAFLTLGATNTSNASTILSGTPSTGTAMLDVRNGSSLAGSFGVLGRLTSASSTSSSAGVRGVGLGAGPGVWGSQNGGIGVFGTAARGTGVRGNASTGVGVYGVHTATTGTAPGISASTNSTANDAAALTATVTPTSPGVYSEAVRGVNNDTGGSGIGVYGQQNGYGYGVRGTAPYGRGVYGSSSTGFGVWGTSASGYGVYGSSFSSYGVYGSSGSSYAGYFNGPVKITGGCTGCAGAALRIDHPLDPAHKYLQHSTVVSPQMKDIYDGVVTTTVNGFATVRLPRYFQALNRSFRYQLTSLSGLQEVAVAKEIAHNRFTIQSEKPRSKVSWQVTGIRHDRYANAHPIKAVVPKAKADQGKYLHPELYGKPKSAGIGYRKPPRLPSRPLQKR